MKYLPPKRAAKVNWQISDQSRAIVEYYAKHSGYSEDDVVDFFLKNLLGDPAFARFLKSQRRTKRLVDRIFYGDDTMQSLNEYGPFSADDFGQEVENTDGILDDGKTSEVSFEDKYPPRRPDRC